MKTLLFVPLLISLSACVKKTTESVTTGGVVTESTPHIWENKTFPKTIYISQEFDADETDNIVDMAAAWDASVENKKQFFSISSTRVTDKASAVTNADDLRDGIFAIYKTTRWPADLPKALAVTQIFGTLYNSGASDEYYAMKHADILVNYRYYYFHATENGASYEFDLQTVILHELGHFIGLGHRKLANQLDTVMYPTINETHKKREPKSIDVVTLADKYNITLSTAGSQIAAPKKEYKPRDAGSEVKMLIELYPNGECIHRQNGVVVKTHKANLTGKI